MHTLHFFVSEDVLNIIDLESWPSGVCSLLHLCAM